MKRLVVTLMAAVLFITLNIDLSIAIELEQEMSGLMDDSLKNMKMVFIVGGIIAAIILYLVYKNK